MFQRTLKVLLAVCLAVSAVSAAVAAPAASAPGNPFIGEWKLDSSKSRMPDEMKVEGKGGNKYGFDFGGGVETIVADGTFQPGLYGTLLSAKSEAPDTWIVARQKDGHLMLRATWKLSSDGSTLTDYYREFNPDGSNSNISMDYVYQRTGGGSGFAADWQSVKETMNFPLLLQVKAFEGDGLSFITPSEQRRKSAKFDGKEYPNEGPNAGDTATSSIRRVDEHNLVMTDKYDGKVVGTENIALSANGKVLTITTHLTRRDKPNVMVFNRQ